MPRITTATEDNDKPRITREEVKSFFDQRAAKISTLGPIRAVIYQDKHPNLAERRNRAEKECILPLLQLNGSQRILDIGCGTGRWTGDLITGCAHYHGLDFSSGLISHARAVFPKTDTLRFSVASADNYSLESLTENTPFNRILCCGVMIYLNDDEINAAMLCMERAAASQTRIVLREPMALGQRLTIKQHYSDELEQDYNAIYRTQAEIEHLLSSTLGKTGFTIIGSGNVYIAEELNNRAETCQRWTVVERT